MDNRLGEMEVFLAITREASLAQAARSLRLTPSAVSRALTRLEARLGTPLVTRTTRALALTPEGERYRERVAGLMDDIDSLERDLGQAAQGPHGLLRVNASVPFGTHCLMPILPDFQDKYPAIMLDLVLTDRVIDLVEERVDVVIRIGPLRDSGLKARKLGHSRMVVVASPAYVARHGEPLHPTDLDAHRCLRFSFRRSIDSWPFRVDGASVQRAINGPFLGNSGEVVRLMACAGGGIARLARFHVKDDLQAGRLVEILCRYNPDDGEDIHALYVARERVSARVRAFLDFVDVRLNV